MRGMARMSQQASVLAFSTFGSTLSIRGLRAAVGSLTMMDYLHCGSTVSVRGFVRNNSGVSLIGQALLGCFSVFVVF